MSGKLLLIAALATCQLLAYDASSEYSCVLLLDKYQIDTVLKSRNGWIRICNNNKILMYLPNAPESEVAKVCSCLRKLPPVTRNRNIQYYNLRE